MDCVYNVFRVQNEIEIYDRVVVPGVGVCFVCNF